jgi:integrase
LLSTCSQNGGERPIASITRQDVTRLLEAIEARGSPVQANRTLARLKTLFAWVQRQEIITSDPTALVDKVIREQARDRVLNEQEIGLFWSACEVAGWPFGPMGKLLLLTAQRRNEVGGMRWGELDLEKRIWTIPRERAKNNRAHEVYLSDLALEVIDRLPRLETEPGFVFTTTGYSHISGYGKARATLHEIMKAQLRQETSDEAATIAQWTFHDLRRTAATGMARLNMPPHVVDRILNHTAGTIRGVAAVYNRFEYLAERKAALEAWGRFVEELIRPNVVRLASA